MARKARREVVDGLCHVTARGNNRRTIFRTDDDYLEALLLLDAALERYGVVCHGFCLIPNSYHAYFDDSRRPPFLTTKDVLDAFDGRLAIARRQLAAFLEDGDSPGTVPYPNPYAPAKRSARRRTSRAAGSPTTFR